MAAILVNVVKSLDYVVRYITLKTGRTLLVSLLVIFLILLVRKALDGKKGGKASSTRLYLRVYLWALLIPVPFMGTLKISQESFLWRKYIYVFLYENVMGTPLWGWLYFAGMAGMALWFLIRKVRLIRRVRNLPVFSPEDSLQIHRGKLKNVTVRLNPSLVTPFSMGIFRPVIVLPEVMIRQFSEVEIQGILQHEYNHIRHGHLILYFVFDCFRIIWFMNPLIHLCSRWMKDDLELLCDQDTIHFGKISPDAYGMLLIRSLDCIDGSQKEDQEQIKAMPALAARRSFRVMKRRIQLIAGYEERRGKQTAAMGAMTGVLVLVLFVLINQFSFPVYTPFHDFSMYSHDAKQVIFMNDPEFNSAVQMTGDGILVQNDKVKKLLAKTDKRYDKEDYFWIYYGGYMKQPGIGGGGGVVQYQPYETEQSVVHISYNKMHWTDVLRDWVFRYM